MPYTQATLGQLVAAIAIAMEDPTHLYWQQAEIVDAINEAFLWWGALTSYWRDRGTFQATAATPFYNLSTKLPALRTRLLTVDDICQQVQWALFEFSTGVACTGLTTQFTAQQLTDAIILATDQFNIDSTQPMAYTAFATAAPPTGRIPLDDSIVAIQRASFRDASTGIWSTLRREDEFSAQSASPDWNLTPGVPRAYAMAVSPPLTMQLFPPAANSGTVGILYSDSKVTGTTGPTSLLDIPDEYALCVKWYALYLLLSSYNEAYDPYRAKYAYERYRQVVAATDNTRVLTRVQVNGRLIPTDTIWALDAARPAWMNQTGTPQYSAATWDMVALAPLSTGGDSITCDVVRTAPIITDLTAYIQIGREETAYIMDYARHILSFKLGGAEFGATFPLYDNFLQGAKQRNQLLSDRVRYITPLFDQERLNENLLKTA